MNDARGGLGREGSGGLGFMLGAVVCLLAVLVLPPAPLGAQDSDAVRQGWTGFLGCWEAEDSDVVGEGALCLIPNDQDVEMLTIIDGEVAFREPFVADGSVRDVERDGCRGTESAYFSEDARRLYTQSNLTCEDGSNRVSTGIMFMPNPGEWLDVRAVGPRGRASAWSRWYRRTGDGVLAALGLAAPGRSRVFGVGGEWASRGQSITIDDVIDASAAVEGSAVEGWLVAVGHQFRQLDAEDIVRLDDAGVPSSVIDVVVAVSFPKHFALGSGEAEPSERATRRAARTIWASPMAYYDPYYSPYGRYGGLYGYGYGGYGYGYSPWGIRYRPVVVEVDRAPRRTGGRVVAGRGYRGPRRAEQPSGGRPGVGSVRTGPTGSGSVSPPSTTGGSGAKTRKAKPRGGR